MLAAHGGATLARAPAAIAMAPFTIIVPQQAISLLHFVPSMQTDDLHGFSVVGFPTVARSGRRPSGGDAPIFLYRLDRLHERFGARLHNSYGSRRGRHRRPLADCPGKGKPSIGRPFHNAELVRTGSSAWLELVARRTRRAYSIGVRVGRGYLNRPALTPKGLSPIRFAAERRPIVPHRDRRCSARSGDTSSAWMIAGQARGFRIETGEIEAALGQHPPRGSRRRLQRSHERQAFTRCRPQSGRAGLAISPRSPASGGGRRRLDRHGPVHTRTEALAEPARQDRRMSSTSPYARRRGARRRGQRNGPTSGRDCAGRAPVRVGGNRRHSFELWPLALPAFTRASERRPARCSSSCRARRSPWSRATTQRQRPIR